MNWYRIKETGKEVETLVRLDRVYRVEARVAESYVYVTLHMDNGQQVLFTLPPDRYPELLAALGA